MSNKKLDNANIILDKALPGKHNAIMNQLSTSEQAQVISALVEGCSINSTVRMTGVSKPTILKLLARIGKACKEYHDTRVVNLTTRKIECDEIWSFCYAKQKNVPHEHAGEFGFGDVWTWTAIDAKSKLIISYLVGLRDGGYAHEFMRDLAKRLAMRVQLTTDGLASYPEAVEAAFGGAIDYAQLIKIYGNERAGEARYSPPECIGTKEKHVCGMPDSRHVSTSFVERQNLTMRMNMRRFTRLTNGFSKKIENHCHMIALSFMHYNFCRIHKTLRVTPAMEMNLSDHVWEIEELLNLMD